MERERLDIAVRELYPTPEPGHYAPWQIAILSGINDSTVRRQIEDGRFEGSFKNDEGEWVIPRYTLIARLLAQEEIEQKREERRIERERQEHNRQPRTPYEPFVPYVPKTRRPKIYTLYHCWGHDGELLYIGQSTDMPRRLKSHMKEKEWFAMLASTTYDYLDTKEDLLAAEKAAIQAENPKYNVVRYGNAA